MNLNNKIAIVTGASSGIGAEFSKMLIENGTTVYGLARSTDKLTRIHEELGKLFIPVTLDITKASAVEKCSFFAEVVGVCVKFNHLVL